MILSHVSIVAAEWGDWKFTGSETSIDLVAASTNALNGALLARRPDHFRQFTITGILLMAILGGIGGGVTRDIILNKIPGAFMNPAYLTLCVVFGIVGYLVAYDSGANFREGWFQFMTAFSLPWYAVVGAQQGVKAGVPVVGCLALAVIGPTAGRYFIDVTCSVTPKQFIQGEWFVGTALISGAVWLAANGLGWSDWTGALIAFLVGFVFRCAALYYAWEEPLAKEPVGVVVHSDRHPHLGRKLSHKSHEQLRDLGLVVEQPNAAPDTSL